MSAHTPGPWMATADTYSEVVVDSAGKEIVVLLGDNAAPNARLIAAAPDLLEALGQTLNAMIHLELSDSSKIEWEASKAAAYAAIAKANGGAV